MITGTLQIKMLSDWHIGSGTGRPGSIDRLIQRDANNLPYIPAKSLTGIWRDGCELVVQGLDAEQSDQPWQQWVNWLFGEQQPGEAENRAIEKAPLTAKLSVRSAHFPKPLQDAFRGNVMLQNMTTFVKPGVKINSRTGSALADHLRFEEMARAGVGLSAEYCLELDGLSPDQQQIAQAILIAGALMVDRLGAKRRRGAGQCEIGVDGMMGVSKAIAAIAETQGQPPPPPPPVSLEVDGTLALENNENSRWQGIVLEVITQSPIIIHQRTVGNHQETQDCIPGTYFVPIVLKQLGNYLNTSLGNALMHGDVVITNANPVVKDIRGEDIRGEAVPFALFEPKEKSAATPIRQRIGGMIATETSNEPQLKGIRRGYVHLAGETLHWVDVNSEIAAHNTIADADQRPTSDVGGIYTYAAIPTGQTFQLEVRIRDYLVPKTAVNPLANFLINDTSVQLGRTKKDDYGRVTLKQIQRQQTSRVAPNPAKDLTVWLLSDLLLRDERLRPTVDPFVFGRRLAAELGVTLMLLDATPADLPQIDRMIAFTRSRRTESWQTKWGLPRPTLVGLSAGTVLQFKVTGTIAPEALQSLEISGFGDRTAEGYGQLCFNPALLTQTNMKLVQVKQNSEDIESQAILIAKSDPGYAYAQFIERETWREMIRRTAGAIAADPGKLSLSLKQSKLTSSKLGTLRTLVDSLRHPDDVARILSVLNHMESKERWQDPTLTKVKELIEDSSKERVWEYYQRSGGSWSQYRLTTLAERDLKRELWAEAVRVLVDACIRAHKRASEQSPSQEQGNG